MAYTTIDKPSDYFNTLLYTGTGSSNAVTGVGFSPGWTWIKSRTATEFHRVIDVVRGAEEEIYTNATDEEFNEAQGLKSFNSDGFTLGTTAGYNGSNKTFVSWNWKAGTSFTNDASSTSVGSIDSAGSVNTDAGFSIMSYTGTGSNATFAHGLGAVPKIAIFKDRSGTGYWMTYHVSIGNGSNLVLNTTDAKSDSAVWWNSTTPTSSVFSIGTSNNINVSGRNYIGYLFAEKQGYSQISSYIGNGAASNGPFIYTGFKPAFIILKSTGTNDWRIIDNKRSSSGGSNPVDKYHYAQSNAVEGASSTNSVPDQIDFLSNGFKIRQASAGINGDGQKFIYFCFAENPFVTSTGVPTTAK